MSSIQFQQNFILTSPEQQLRLLSLEPTVGEISFQNQKLSSIQIKNKLQKNNFFEFESWNVSQELKPYQNKEKSNGKLASALSTSISLNRKSQGLWSSNRNHYRTKTMTIKNQSISPNSNKRNYDDGLHSFNFKRKRRMTQFFHTSISHSQKPNVQQQYQTINDFKSHIATIKDDHQQFQRQRSKIKQKIHQKNSNFNQKQKRIKIIQNYLIKAKEKVMKEKADIQIKLQNAIKLKDKINIKQKQPQKSTFFEFPIKINQQSNRKFSTNKKTIFFNKIRKQSQSKNILQTKNKIMYTQRVIKTGTNSFRKFSQHVMDIDVC